MSKKGRKTQMSKRKLRLGFGDTGEWFLDALVGETDRGVALVAAEFIGDALEVLLRAQFCIQKAGKALQETLISRSPTSPLFSFAMKINFCRAFGLIEEPIFVALNHLKSIRNHCAHSTRVDLREKSLYKHVRGLREFADLCCKRRDERKSFRDMFRRYGEEFNSISFQRRSLLRGAFFLEYNIVVLGVMLTDQLVPEHQRVMRYDHEIELDERPIRAAGRSTDARKGGERPCAKDHSQPPSVKTK